MVLNSSSEVEPGWYVLHTTFKIEDSSELNAILNIIENTAPWIVANVSVSYKRLNGWEEVDEYL